MADEFAKADLVVSRAGATTVAELQRREGRRFLPFPFAADDHQLKNAEAVARVMAGGNPQIELTSERLADEVIGLINDARRLEEMGRAKAKLAHRDARGKSLILPAALSGLSTVE
jgi:UDP-N-acetylglucosamine--N-acetylmuramyl-(pentapeptide) pyrophosphoryl-undecaprenol N-acetylglucosamine transferase